MFPFFFIILLWLHVDVEDWVDRAFGQSAVVLTHLHVDVPILHSSMESKTKGIQDLFVEVISIPDPSSFPTSS